jgi:predicted amidophosphoribosyltransferase
MENPFNNPRAQKILEKASENQLKGLKKRVKKKQNKALCPRCRKRMPNTTYDGVMYCSECANDLFNHELTGGKDGKDKKTA